MSLTDDFNPRKTHCLFGLNKTFIFLNNLIEKNKFPRALLLTGNKGIGKATLINHFMINYFDSNNYDKNRNSLIDKNIFFEKIQKNSYPNIVFLNDHYIKNLNIDEIRSLKSQLQKSVINNDKRFIILDEIDKLSINCANALLKMIEEPSNNNFFILINNKSKPLLETIKSRCIEIKLIISEKERIHNTNKLMEYFEQKTNLDINLVKTSPGNFLRYNKIFNDLDLDFEGNFLENIKSILDLFKKERNLFIKDLLLFFTDYYTQLSRLKNNIQSIKVIENRSFIVKNINDFFMYNLNQNSLINSIENKLINE
tara:strand:- start:89 stop:1024 length:936 start_codon:yes stop_codon:yes gene_type:complete